MHKICAQIVVSLCLVAAFFSAPVLADEDAAGEKFAPQFALAVNAGVGLNEWLIQSGSITSTEVLGLDARLDVDTARYWDWLFGVDQTYVAAHIVQLRGEHKQQSEIMNVQVFTYGARWLTNTPIAFDAAIGYAHLEHDRYEEIRMAGKDNFMLDFALVYRPEESENSDWEISLRYRHFSSGYLRSPNPGIDYAVLQIARYF